MSSISRARATADGRSGGKIVKRRRTSVAKTPYERPTANPPPPTQNPNWLTGLVFPATRKIATGAGLLISSIFTDDTFSSSSSSSSSESSSSDTDCCSEDDVDSGNSGDDIPYDEPAELEKNNGISSEMIKFGEDPQPAKGKNNTKQLIEQLLIQEIYSREECDRLIKIISSRVVDLPTRTGGQDAIETPDMRNKAVAEAKKWLEEKKVGSSSKSELDRSTHGFYSGLIPYGSSTIDDGGLGGSPVDMAKSYMQRRPPWSSPRHNIHMMDLEFESTTPTPIMLFDQQTPTSSSFTQKKDSLASGSWNIREEIRRVRSKATEDMLLRTTVPSTKNDLSLFPSQAPNSSSTQYSFLEDSNSRPICPSDNIYDSNSLAPAKPIHDASLTSAQGPVPHGFPGDSALETTHNDSTKNEALLIVVPEPKQQESEAMQIGEEGGAVSKSRHSSPELFPLIDPTRSSDGNACTTKEVVKISSTPSAENNGLASTKSSLSAGMVDAACEEPKNEKPNREMREDGDDRSRRGMVGVEETCELLSEASMEVPDVNMETNNDNDKDSITGPHQEMKVTSSVDEENELVVVKVAGTKTPRRTPAVVVENKPARVARKGNRGRGGK